MHRDCGRQVFDGDAVRARADLLIRNRRALFDQERHAIEDDGPVCRFLCRRACACHDTDGIPFVPFKGGCLAESNSRTRQGLSLIPV